MNIIAVPPQLIVDPIEYNSFLATHRVLRTELLPSPGILSGNDFGIIGVLGPDYATYPAVKAALRTLALLSNEYDVKTGYSRLLSIFEQVRWLKRTNVILMPEVPSKSESACRRTFEMAKVKKYNASKSTSYKAKNSDQLSTSQVDEQQKYPLSANNNQIPTTSSGRNDLQPPTSNQLTETQRVDLRSKEPKEVYPNHLRAANIINGERCLARKFSKTSGSNSSLSATVIKFPEQLISQILSFDVTSPVSGQKFSGKKEEFTLPVKRNATGTLPDAKRRKANPPTVKIRLKAVMPRIKHRKRPINTSKIANSRNLTNANATILLDTQLRIPDLEVTPKIADHHPKPIYSQKISTVISPIQNFSRISTGCDRDRPRPISNPADKSSPQCVPDVPKISNGDLLHSKTIFRSQNSQDSDCSNQLNSKERIVKENMDPEDHVQTTTPDAIFRRQRPQNLDCSNKMKDDELAVEANIDFEDPVQPETPISNSSGPRAHTEMAPSQAYAVAKGSGQLHASARQAESREQLQEIVVHVAGPAPELILPELLFFIPRPMDRTHPLAVQSLKDFTARCLHARQEGRHTYHMNLWTIMPSREPAPQGKEYYLAYFDGQLVEGLRLVLVHDETMDGDASYKICVYGCLSRGTHRWIGNSRYV